MTRKMRIARLSRRMSKYTCIEHDAPKWRLKLCIGAQGFGIWDYFESQEEAVWMEKMLHRALAKLIIMEKKR